MPNPLKDLWPALQRFSIDSCATSLYVDRGSGVEVSTWDVDRLKAMMVAIRERIRRAEENPEDEDLQVGSATSSSNRQGMLVGAGRGQ